MGWKKKGNLDAKSNVRWLRWSDRNSESQNLLLSWSEPWFLAGATACSSCPSGSYSSVLGISVIRAYQCVFKKICEKAQWVGVTRIYQCAGIKKIVLDSVVLVARGAIIKRLIAFSNLLSAAPLRLFFLYKLFGWSLLEYYRCWPGASQKSYVMPKSQYLDK